MIEKSFRQWINYRDIYGDVSTISFFKFNELCCAVHKIRWSSLLTSVADKNNFIKILTCPKSMSTVTNSYPLSTANDGLCQNEWVPSIAFVIGWLKSGSEESQNSHIDCCL